MIEKNLDTAIFLSIYEAATRLMRKNVELVSKAGITNQQWIILIHLAKDPNLPYLIREPHGMPLMASELAESLGVTRANITNLINVLLDKKLVKQVEDRTDKRKKRLTLTAKGEDLISNMQPQRVRSNAKMLVGLDEAQKIQLLKYMQIVNDKLLGIQY